MQETIIRCYICKKVIGPDKGTLELAGRVSCSTCGHIHYKDVCYECTEKLFWTIKEMKGC